MADNDCESQMFANVPEGFVKLLSFVVQVAMGPSVRPVLKLYPHKINDSLTMHQAAVQFKGGRAEIRRFRFLGIIPLKVVLLRSMWFQSISIF